MRGRGRSYTCLEASQRGVQGSDPGKVKPFEAQECHSKFNYISKKSVSTQAFTVSMKEKRGGGRRRKKREKEEGGGRGRRKREEEEKEEEEQGKVRCTK